MFKKIAINSLFLLAMGTAYASTSSFVGPLLNFIDAGEKNDKWTLSALVVAPSSVEVSSLGLYIGVCDTPRLPEVIQKVRDHTFLRYSLPFERNEKPYKTTYTIGSQGKIFEIFIPKKDSDPHVFFGTCNQLLDPPSTWEPINKKHAENPYHLALLAGDQLYVDKPGVLGVPPVATIMTSDEKTRLNSLTSNQIQEIDKALEENLLDQYLAQYSKLGFAEFLATVPTKSLADDHEYYDGKGSQNPSLPVFERIDSVADRFYYLFQHHTTKEKSYETGLIGPASSSGSLSPLSSYSYLLKFETVAFYGLDTRTERTLNQISSIDSRDFMFSQLKELKQRNIFVITGIPVVYQNLNFLYNVFNVINQNSWLKSIFDKITKQPEARRNLDITTDFSDQWNFPSHIDERNDLVRRLSSLALGKASVTLLAGDVHCAAASEVYNQYSGQTRLRQLTSSAISTEPQSAGAIRFRKFASTFQSPETYSKRLVQRLTGFVNSETGATSQELPFNNWLDLTIVEGKVHPILLTFNQSTVQNWLPQGWPQLEN